MHRYGRSIDLCPVRISWSGLWIEGAMQVSISSASGEVGACIMVSEGRGIRRP